MLFTLCFSLALSLSCAKPANVSGTTSTAGWVASHFTQCSANCNGGFMVRSVRCLDSDGVISHVCEPLVRPESYKICNQVDCITQEFNVNLKPFPGTYYFEPSGALEAVLEYQYQARIPNRHHHDQPQSSVKLSVLELDGTRTTAHTNGTCITYDVTPAETAGVFSPNNTNLTLGSLAGRHVVPLSSHLHLVCLGSEEWMVYRDNALYKLGNSGHTLYNSPISKHIHTLLFCDGYRVYEFSVGKSIPVGGPGFLFISPASQDSNDGGVAIYFYTAGPSSFSSVIHHLKEIVLNNSDDDDEGSADDEPTMGYYKNDDGSGVSPPPQADISTTTVTRTGFSSTDDPGATTTMTTTSPPPHGGGRGTVSAAASTTTAAVPPPSRDATTPPTGTATPPGGTKGRRWERQTTTTYPPTATADTASASPGREGVVAYTLPPEAVQQQGSGIEAEEDPGVAEGVDVGSG